MWIIQGKAPDYNVFWKNPYNTVKEEDGKKCNELKPYPLAECLDYVLTYSDKGDMVIFNGIPHLYMELANG